MFQARSSNAQKNNIGKLRKTTTNKCLTPPGSTVNGSHLIAAIWVACVGIAVCHSFNTSLSNSLLSFPNIRLDRVPCPVTLDLLQVGALVPSDSVQLITGQAYDESDLLVDACRNMNRYLKNSSPRSQAPYPRREQCGFPNSTISGLN